MRVGYYQFRPLFGKPDWNCTKVLGAVRDVDAELIVLPELAFTGYNFRDRDEARSLAEEPGRSGIVQSLTALCAERELHLVTGFAERARDKVFNSALLIGPRGIVRTYRKLHLFNDERDWFDPGDTPLAVDRVRDARVGMMVCFDWIFPEVARTLALMGADVLAHPANLVLDFCQQAMQTRSLENGVFSITTNRYGEERRPHGTMRFTGRSQIVGPRGGLLHRGPAARESLEVLEIDPAEARDKRITPRNLLLKERRLEFYA